MTRSAKALSPGRVRCVYGDAGFEKISEMCSNAAGIRFVYNFKRRGVCTDVVG